MATAPLTVFDHLGGEQGLRVLVDRFYFHMDARKDSQGIRKMHPEDLGESKDKLCSTTALYHQADPKLDSSNRAQKGALEHPFGKQKRIYEY